MNYYQNIERAIIYIEGNLISKLNLEDVASAACLSKFHFHRLFKLLIGDTVSEYIRKRRLYNASQDLIYSDKKISEIAYDYQFESHEAFTRSFQSIFNTTPKKYRENRIERVVYEKQKVQNDKLLHIIGGISKNPVIKEIHDIKLAGYSITTSVEMNKIEIPAVWQLFNKTKKDIEKVHPDKVTIGVFSSKTDFDLDNFSSDTEVTYTLGLRVEQFSKIPEGMQTMIIPKAKYAVFTHKGGFEKLRLSYVYVYGTWLQKSKCELSGNPGFEWYDSRFKGPFNNDSEIDIYIPIK